MSGRHITNITNILKRLDALERTVTTKRRRLNKKETAEREGISPRSIDRRAADPASGFPQPEIVEGRCYWWSDELEKYDEACRVKGAALADVKEARRERVAAARKTLTERRRAGGTR